MKMFNTVPSFIWNWSLRLIIYTFSHTKFGGCSLVSTKVSFEKKTIKAKTSKCFTDVKEWAPSNMMEVKSVQLFGWGSQTLRVITSWKSYRNCDRTENRIYISRFKHVMNHHLFFPKRYQAFEWSVWKKQNLEGS